MHAWVTQAGKAQQTQTPGRPSMTTKNKLDTLLLKKAAKDEEAWLRGYAVLLVARVR